MTRLSFSGLLASLLLCGSLAGGLAAQVPAQAPSYPSATPAAAERQADEAAIRDAVTKFVAAYNAHDAPAVAALFLPGAQIINLDESVIEGRAAIEALFSELFEEQPETGIEVNIDAIRFIGPNLAVESGTTVTVPPEGETPESGRYSVLHVRQEGKWSMAVIRDMPDEPTGGDHLEALAWMVGDWLDESREGVVRTSCRWADNGNFLLQEIKATPRGREPMEISQRIGWDPLGQRFKSWVFDSEGGYGEGVWTPTETGWLIKFTAVNRDGLQTSATNHIEPLGPDRYQFRSVDRVLGNEMLPPSQVTVVRQPPAPATASPASSE